MHRFWVAIMAGTYATHGETYRLPAGQISWTSGGSVLRGQSPARIAFLKKIVEEGPADGINPIDKWQDIAHRRQAQRVLSRLLRQRDAVGMDRFVADGEVAAIADETSCRNHRRLEYDDHTGQRRIFTGPGRSVPLPLPQPADDGAAWKTLYCNPAHSNSRRRRASRKRFPAKQRSCQRRTIRRRRQPAFSIRQISRITSTNLIRWTLRRERATR